MIRRQKVKLNKESVELIHQIGCVAFSGNGEEYLFLPYVFKKAEGYDEDIYFSERVDNILDDDIRELISGEIIKVTRVNESEGLKCLMGYMDEGCEFWCDRAVKLEHILFRIPKWIRKIFKCEI